MRSCTEEATHVATVGMLCVPVSGFLYERGNVACGQWNLELHVLSGEICSLFVSAELTSVTLLRNDLDTDSATMLATIAKEKGISLCGIAPEQTEANFAYQHLGSADGILVASDLFVRASLTRLDVSRNILDRDGQGVKMLRDAVRERKGFTLLDDDND